MKPKIQQSLDDIVFEGRNQAYGAFALRQSYSKHLYRAMWIGCGSVLFFFLSSFAYLKITKPPEIITVKTIVNVDLMDEDLFTPVEEKEKTPPPVKIEKIAQIKYPDMIEPKPDMLVNVEEAIPTQEELSDKIISSENVIGLLSDDAFVIPPSPISTDDGKVEKAPIVEEEKTLISAEIMPEFSGGMTEMYRWLSKNLSYPANAARNNIQGKVVVSFTVEKNGSITDVKVLKGIGFGCDEETIRVIKAMPKWNAGKQNGHNVRVKYTLPLTFKLDS